MMMKKVVVFTLTHLSLILSGFAIGSFSVSLPLIRDELLFTDAQIGFLASLNLWGMMIGALVLGFLADRVGRKYLLILSFAISSLVNGLIFFTDNYQLLAIFRFITGIGIGAITPLAVSLIAEFFGSKKRTMLLTVLMTGIPLGQLVVSFTGIFVLQHFNWRVLFLLSFIGVFLTPIMMKFLPETMQSSIAGKNRQRLLQRRYIPNLIALSLVFFSNLYVFYGVSIWLPGLMAIQGLALISGIVFLAVFLIGNISIPILAGGLSQRFGYKKIMVFFYIGLMAMIALLSNGIGSFWSYLFVFLVGGCVGVAQNMVVAIAPRFFPSEIRSSALGICSACSRIGSALAPIVVGILVTMNITPAHIFQTFMIPAAIGLIALLSTCSLGDEAL